MTTVLIDITDSSIPRPDFVDIQRYLELKSDKWQGIHCKRSVISHAQYGDELVVSLAAGDSFMGNEYERKKKMVAFQKEIQGILDVNTEDEITHSVIYPAIVREANELMKHRSEGKRNLLIYSDLIENTTKVSLHRVSIDSLYPANTKQIWQEMEQKYAIALEGDLTGLEVRIIYQTPNYDTSQRFSNLADMYRREFERRGAIVTITGLS